MKTRTTLSVAVLACLMSPAFAQSTSAPSTTGPGATGMGTRDESTPSTADTRAEKRESLTSEEFVKKAAAANMSEIAASQVAIEKAQSPAVKTFAQQMITDHTKASEQLKTLASSKGYKVPDEPDMMHKAAMVKLKAKSGDSFDQAYTEQMRKDHATAVELFSNAANSSQLDPELRQFAKQTLPTLQHHKQVALQTLPNTGG
jgi:putative membrane protein